MENDVVTAAFDRLAMDSGFTADQAHAIYNLIRAVMDEHEDPREEWHAVSAKERTVGDELDDDHRRDAP